MDRRIIPLEALPNGQLMKQTVYIEGDGTKPSEFLPTSNLNFTVALNYVLRGYKVWNTDTSILEPTEWLAMMPNEYGEYGIVVTNEYLNPHWFVITESAIQSSDWYVDMSKKDNGLWQTPQVSVERQTKINLGVY